MVGQMNLGEEDIKSLQSVDSFDPTIPPSSLAKLIHHRLIDIDGIGDICLTISGKRLVNLFRDMVSQETPSDPVYAGPVSPGPVPIEFPGTLTKSEVLKKTMDQLRSKNDLKEKRKLLRNGKV